MGYGFAIFEMASALTQLGHRNLRTLETPICPQPPKYAPEIEFTNVSPLQYFAVNAKAFEVITLHMEKTPAKYYE